MKKIISIAFTLLTLNGFSQKTALLSNDFKKAILYTDSVTLEQIASGYFPISVKDFDTLIGSLSYLKKILKEPGRSNME